MGINSKRLKLISEVVLEELHPNEFLAVYSVLNQG